MDGKFSLTRALVAESVVGNTEEPLSSRLLATVSECLNIFVLQFPDFFKRVK